MTQEFSEAYVVDLGGDVRANPKLSGTKHNVFGIQTGVAISFFVKRHGAAAKKQGCRVFYARRPEMETAEEKLAFVSSERVSELPFEEIRPDAKHNWLNLTSNDFDELTPLVDRSTNRTPRGMFELSTNGVNTARDDWVYAISIESLLSKMQFGVEEFNREHRRWAKVKSIDREAVSRRIKWSESLFAKIQRAPAPAASGGFVVTCSYRPFVRLNYYADPIFSDRLTSKHFAIFGPSLERANECIAVSAPSLSSPFRVLASSSICDWHFMGDTQIYPRFCYDGSGQRVDNIADWALARFQKRYQSGRVKKPRLITKGAVFNYVYAVLHDPLYREKYAQNLRREFPRVPLYGDTEIDFWKWVAWGEELMALHNGYEAIEPFPLTRLDIPDQKVRAAGQSPKPSLKADREAGRIIIDSETTLAGIPATAWRYQLGNRSALEWVLDQYKERKPKDATIRAQFDTYRMADHKERVIDLLKRVATVSVETVRIIEAIESAPR